MGIVWQGLHAKELKPQTIYAIEDAEEVRTSLVRIVSLFLVSIFIPSKAAAYLSLSSLRHTMR